MLAARYLHDFSECRGIEFLRSVHDMAVIALAKYGKQTTLPVADAKATHDLSPLRSASSIPDKVIDKVHGITLECGDFLKLDWSDSDVIFAHSTCFGKELVAKLAVLAEKLKPGSCFITSTFSLNSRWFNLTACVRYEMSWGIATFYVHKKVRCNSQ